MFASTCIDVPMLIDEQPRKRNMSASSVESALLEPKKQKRLEEQSCIQAQESRGAIYEYRQWRPAFKSDHALQQQQQQQHDRRSFNNCIRPTTQTMPAAAAAVPYHSASNTITPLVYDLPWSTPVEFIQHRDKRFKRTPMPCGNIAKRSNKIEDAWERMDQDRANLIALAENHRWSTQ